MPGAAAQQDLGSDPGQLRPMRVARTSSRRIGGGRRDSPSTIPPSGISDHDSTETLAWRTWVYSLNSWRVTTASNGIFACILRKRGIIGGSVAWMSDPSAAARSEGGSDIRVFGERVAIARATAA
jgi:hypothetical protein